MSKNKPCLHGATRRIYSAYERELHQLIILFVEDKPERQNGFTTMELYRFMRDFYEVTPSAQWLRQHLLQMKSDGRLIGLSENSNDDYVWIFKFPFAK